MQHKVGRLGFIPSRLFVFWCMLRLFRIRKGWTASVPVVFQIRETTYKKSLTPHYDYPNIHLSTQELTKMAQTKNIQLRGHCQCCGREQAVVSGRMSKHGYTVDDGWFNGVCTGQHYAPIEHDRGQLDSIVNKVLSQCEALRVKAADLQAGRVFPAEAKSGNRVKVEKMGAYGRRAEYVDEMIPFAQASKYQKKCAVESAILASYRRAKIGEAFARDLCKMADEYHGKPLQEVAKQSGRAPICIGEQRKSNRGILTVYRVDGARVYWKDARGFQSWTGSSSWRKMEEVKG